MKKMYSRKELLKYGFFSIRSSIELMEEAGLNDNIDEKIAFYERVCAKAVMLHDLDLISVDKFVLLERIIYGIFFYC